MPDSTTTVFMRRSKSVSRLTYDATDSWSYASARADPYIHSTQDVACVLLQRLSPRLMLNSSSPCMTSAPLRDDQQQSLSFGYLTIVIPKSLCNYMAPSTNNFHVCLASSNETMQGVQRTSA